MNIKSWMSVITTRGDDLESSSIPHFALTQEIEGRLDFDQLILTVFDVMAKMPDWPEGNARQTLKNLISTRAEVTETEILGKGQFPDELAELKARRDRLEEFYFKLDERQTVPAHPAANR